MGRWIFAVLVASMQIATSTASPGQQASDQEYVLSREQWQQRVEQARRHSESFVAGARTGQRDSPTADASSADTELPREQWQQRVEDARRRTEAFVARAGREAPDPPPHDLLQREASERALNDPTLQAGDIVSTGSGFVVFLGRPEDREPVTGRQ